jgi:phosphoribosylamine--glycine ligase
VARILIVGSGGREHALAWRAGIEGHRVWAAPGSDGIARDAQCVPVRDLEPPGLLDIVQSHDIDLVIIGPEQPLVSGLADRLRDANVPVFGPGAAAARLEGSKADAKQFMLRHNVPTASARVASTIEAAYAAIREFDEPPVIKADGLAAGKGVTVAESFEQAEAAARACLQGRRFGDAGARVVIEQRLRGTEASFFVITDGSHVATLAAAQDHKRLLDGDKGPNTGGMGAFAPSPVVTEAVRERVLQSIVQPTLSGLRREGRPFVGVLFVGLMIDGAGRPWVVEYNCRFGDPETQALLFGLQQPLVEVLLDAAAGRLKPIDLAAVPSVAVVLASAGYPGSSGTPAVISGIEAATAEDTQVFHAGTRHENGRWVTAGGRVLSVCGRGPNLSIALERAYAAARSIGFEGQQMRGDIGGAAATEVI